MNHASIELIPLPSKLKPLSHAVNQFRMARRFAALNEDSILLHYLYFLSKEDKI